MIIQRVLDRLRQVGDFVKHLIRSSHLHGVHSPMGYEFEQLILKGNRQFYFYEQIRSYHKKWRSDITPIQLQTAGAPSRYGSVSETHGDVTKRTAIPFSFGKVLFELINWKQSRAILELGTSLGQSALFMAAATSGRVFTIEASEALLRGAKERALEAGLDSKITFVHGTFQERLPNVLNSMSKVDFAFVDGDHRFSSTIAYWEMLLPYMGHQSVVVFDDIYWSIEMRRAWEQIKQHHRVGMTIDLFRLGIVFLDVDAGAQHLCLRA